MSIKARWAAVEDGSDLARCDEPLGRAVPSGP